MIARIAFGCAGLAWLGPVGIDPESLIDNRYTPRQPKHRLPAGLVPDGNLRNSKTAHMQIHLGQRDAVQMNGRGGGSFRVPSLRHSVLVRGECRVYSTYPLPAKRYIRDPVQPWPGAIRSSRVRRRACLTCHPRTDLNQRLRITSSQFR